MSLRTLRHIASILLLATYVPMVTLSSLHIHHDTMDIRDNCLQCAGHFDNHHHHQHDCLYCNFMSQHYVGQPMSLPDVVLPFAERIICTDVKGAEARGLGVAMLRAPPVA